MKKYDPEDPCPACGAKKVTSLFGYDLPATYVAGNTTIGFFKRKKCLLIVCRSCDYKFKRSFFDESEA